MRTPRARRTGLTLVEVLLTMAIVAMVLAALTQLQDSGARAAVRASLTAEASTLCQSEIDKWLTIARSDARLDVIEPIDTAPGWSRRMTLQKTPNSTATSLSALTVEVYRHGRTSPEYTLSRWIPSSTEGDPR